MGAESDAREVTHDTSERRSIDRGGGKHADAGEFEDALEGEGGSFSLHCGGLDLYSVSTVVKLLLDFRPVEEQPSQGIKG